MLIIWRRIADAGHEEPRGGQRRKQGVCGRRQSALILHCSLLFEGFSFFTTAAKVRAMSFGSKIFGIFSTVCYEVAERKWSKETDK